MFCLSPGSGTVECYNMKKNEWTFVTSMVEPHYGHAGTVHADLMYISGMETLMDMKTVSFDKQGDSSESLVVWVNALTTFSWC